MRYIPRSMHNCALVFAECRGQTAGDLAKCSIIQQAPPAAFVTMEPPVDLVLLIKHAGEELQIGVAADATVAQLKQAVEARTGVFARRQKLIYKGKTLDQDAAVLAGLPQLRTGAHIMLLVAGSEATGIKVWVWHSAAPHGRRSRRRRSRISCPPTATPAGMRRGH